jgi:uncharacterized membrane protein YphA (DoxX/SURF4 family)
MSDLFCLFLRLMWGGMLLAVSGTGLNKSPEKFKGTVAGLGPPFDAAPELGAALAIFAETVIPAFLILGRYTRRCAMIAIVHFSIACYAHLVVWGQGVDSIIFSKTDPSGIGASVWLVGALAILVYGPGRFSVDSYVSNMRQKKD